MVPEVGGSIPLAHPRWVPCEPLPSQCRGPPSLAFGSLRVGRLSSRPSCSESRLLDLSHLPAVNASLNAVAALLLVRGRQLARARRIAEHRRTMLGAFAVSSLFLALYVLHKAARGFESTTFHVEGAAKLAYLVLLASHVALAMTVPVFAILAIRLGLLGRVDAHRRLVRVAWPIWMYVSVTGVLIYVLLYHVNPGA